MEHARPKPARTLFFYLNAHAVSHATDQTDPPLLSLYLPVQLPQQIEGRVRGEDARELEIEDDADAKRQEARGADGLEGGRGAPAPVGGGFAALGGLDHEDDAEREGDSEEGVAHEVLAVLFIFEIGVGLSNGWVCGCLFVLWFVGGRLASSMCVRQQSKQSHSR